MTAVRFMYGFVYLQVMIHDLEDTICAVSTAPGQGAIAMIRISGKNTGAIVSGLIRFTADNTTYNDLQPNHTRLGRFMIRNELVDEVMVTKYKAPHSYTGEDMAEITCHGSVFIQQKIMLALIEAGARAAGPGEFTRRAYLNRKMDLAQAEAVADLIAAESAAAHRLALTQLRGKISNKIRELRMRLLDVASLVELELDFSEEDVEFADRKQLLSLSGEVLTMIHTLSDSFQQGNAMKRGIPVAIIGEPNVGKSTLLNALLQDERAIVSEIPGTTRDSIEDTFVIEGILFRFIDTAGLRHSTDRIEQIGVERTYRKASDASIILYMAELDDDPAEILGKTEHLFQKMHNKNQQLIFVINKTDMAGKEKIKEAEKHWKSFSGNTVFISARNETNLDGLRKLLVELSAAGQVTDQDIIISNVRHYEALQHTGKALERMITGIREGLSNDLLAQDLREAIHYLGEITGDITTDDILGNIFSKFCIGK